MAIDVIISSPLAILAQVENLLATIINAILLYIIYKYTPQKMIDIRIFLMTMAASQCLIGLCGLGSVPEYMYPLPVIRINGCFKLIGTTYGGPFTIIEIVFLYTIGGICVTECSYYRYYTLSHKKYHLNTKIYLISHLAIGISVIFISIFISRYFLMSIEELKKYAHLRGLSLQTINLENDVLTILNIDSPYCLPIFALAASLIISIAVISYILNFLTHQYMKRYFAAATIGQGSIPLLLPAIVIGILGPSIPEAMDGRAPSQFTWELCLCAAQSYQVFSPILTVLLTTPYYTPIKQWIRKVKQSLKQEPSITVIKF